VDSLVSNYVAIVNSAIAGVQHLGLATVPLVLVAAVIINMFGGVRALSAIAGTIVSVIVLTLILENAMALSTWSTGLIGGPH
jgi:hypothetical protein